MGGIGEHGLDRRALGLQGMESGEIKIGGGEIQGCGGKQGQGGGFNWDWAERAGQGQGVINYIVSTKDMDYITGEFGDVGDKVRLSGGPRQRGTEKGAGKRFVIGEQGEFSGF